MVDLDAALGIGSNAELVRSVLRIAPCRVGGGIRDLESAIRWLDDGARKVLTGTTTIEEVLRVTHVDEN